MSLDVFLLVLMAMGLIAYLAYSWLDYRGPSP